jgi:XTP/dITP diphosphohydrolase
MTYTKRPAKSGGKILHSLSGVNGFGYDPLFLPDGYNESFAQIPSSEKNRISHRGRALADLKHQLLK